MFDRRFVALPMMTALVSRASVRQILENMYSTSFSGSSRNVRFAKGVPRDGPICHQHHTCDLEARYFYDCCT